MRTSNLVPDCKSLSNIKQYPRIVASNIRDWRIAYVSPVEAGIRGRFYGGTDMKHLEATKSENMVTYPLNSNQVAVNRFPL